MYKILVIETGEYLYKTNQGRLYSSLKNFAYREKFGKIATYKYKNTIHKIFIDGKVNLYINDSLITLNKETKPLFEIVEE
jgi:hypothetical protein